MILGAEARFSQGKQSFRKPKMLLLEMGEMDLGKIRLMAGGMGKAIDSRSHAERENEYFGEY